MTAPAKSRLVPYAECCDCDWVPDPESRASATTQADRHSDDTLHPVRYGQRPPAEGDDKVTATDSAERADGRWT